MKRYFVLFCRWITGIFGSKSQKDSVQLQRAEEALAEGMKFLLDNAKAVLFHGKGRVGYPLLVSESMRERVSNEITDMFKKEYRTVDVKVAIPNSLYAGMLILREYQTTSTSQEKWNEDFRIHYDELLNGSVNAAKNCLNR